MEETNYKCRCRTHRRDKIGQNVTMDEWNFEIVDKFKYNGTVTTDNDIEEEIPSRIHSGNCCLYALRWMFTSKNLSRVLFWLSS